MTPDQIITDIARKVYNEFGGGYTETIYEEAVAVELRDANIDYRIQPVVEVMYRGHKVGEQRLDFVLVSGKVVVELKAVANVSKNNRAQLRAYCRTINADRGVLINFPPEGDDITVENVLQEDYT